MVTKVRIDPEAELRLIMIADGTIDALIKEQLGIEPDLDSPERQEAREATREFCVRYCATMFDDCGDLDITLGDLAIALDFFYNGYLSGLKREVVLD